MTYLIVSASYVALCVGLAILFWAWTATEPERERGEPFDERHSGDDPW